MGRGSSLALDNFDFWQDIVSSRKTKTCVRHYRQQRSGLQTRSNRQCFNCSKEQTIDAQFQALDAKRTSFVSGGMALSTKKRDSNT